MANCEAGNVRANPVGTTVLLERELGRELDAARAASAEERVADAHVARRNDMVGSVAYFATPASCYEATPAGSRMRWGRLTYVASRVGNKRRQQRIGEVWMIEDVKEFRTELQTQLLADLRVLVNREIPLFEGRTL